jgi:hypothetical protein
MHFAKRNVQLGSKPKESRKADDAEQDIDIYFLSSGFI